MNTHADSTTEKHTLHAIVPRGKMPTRQKETASTAVARKDARR